MELNKGIFKWLMISNLVLIVLLFATNIGWLVYESQFQQVTEETVEYTQSVENVNTMNDVIQNIVKE